MQPEGCSGAATSPPCRPHEQHHCPTGLVRQSSCQLQRKRCQKEAHHCRTSQTPSTYPTPTPNPKTLLQCKTRTLLFAPPQDAGARHMQVHESPQPRCCACHRGEQAALHTTPLACMEPTLTRPQMQEGWCQLCCHTPTVQDCVHCLALQQLPATDPSHAECLRQPVQTHANSPAKEMEQLALSSGHACTQHFIPAHPPAA